MKTASFLLLFLVAFSACKKDKDTSIIVYQDNLTSDNLTWPTDSNSSVVKKFDQGHLSFLVKTDGVNARIVAPYDSIVAPYSLQADVIIETSDVSKFGEAGVLFNYIDADNFDAFQVSSDGTYRLWEKYQGVVSTLISSNSNASINTTQGATNTLKVIQRTSNVELQVNNNAITTFSIPLQNTNCGAGLVVSTYSTPDYSPVTAKFNNFVIRKL